MNFRALWIPCISCAKPDLRPFGANQYGGVSNGRGLYGLGPSILTLSTCTCSASVAPDGPKSASVVA